MHSGVLPYIRSKALRMLGGEKGRTGCLPHTYHALEVSPLVDIKTDMPL